MSIPEEWFGHAPKVREIVTYRCSDCGRELRRVGTELSGYTFLHQPRGGFETSGDRHAYDKAQEAVAKAARLAEAKPYSGAIKQCQAHVSEDMGRWTDFRRCSKPARFVVKRKPRHEEVEDILAVCALHARDGNSRRFEASGHDYRGKKSADEQVEEEYR